MSQISVTKRSGNKEPLDLEKIHRVLEWATDGITGVSISEIELRANIQLYDGIPAYDIHELLIKSASELISVETPNYQYVAARLVNYKLRKDVYGQYEPTRLYDLVVKNVKLGVYDPLLLQLYSEAEFDAVEKFIKHERDYEFAYAGMVQLREKYLIRDRRKRDGHYETPQVCYALIGMTLFSMEDPAIRLSWIKRFYDAASTFMVSLPTPIMAGCRTPIRQFSSCVLIDSDDSLDSINETASAIVKYASKKAGIGINGGRLRAVGSKVGDGSVIHTGLIPFWKYWRAALKSCSQGGVRGASGNICFPFFHLEVEDLIVLKDNKGTEENRIRNMDYTIQLNGHFLDRVRAGLPLYLFSPHDVEDLYEAFFADQKAFVTLYDHYALIAESGLIRHKKIDSREFLASVLLQRQTTARLYIMFADHCNTHSSFKEKLAAICMTNLCVEVTLPTVPLASKVKPPEIALCTLAGINWGKIVNPSDFEEPATVLVRALDNLLSYQEYPHPAAEYSTAGRRSLGIGIISLAHFLAKRDLKYDASAFETVDRYAEAFSYYLIKASVDLAEERGACSMVDETKYSDGILPIDTYCKAVDELVEPNFQMDWANLRAKMLLVGIRNSTLMALMPAETSAQVIDEWNGIEPPPALVTQKASKDGAPSQVVPNVARLKNKYHLRWDQNPSDYIRLMAIIQKYVDQSGSYNTSHNPAHYGGQIPMSQLMSDLFLAHKYGLKTLYYANALGETENQITNMADLKAPEVVDVQADEICDSCVL